VALGDPVVQAGGVQLRLHKGMVPQQVAQKAAVVAHAQQYGVVQQGAQAPDGVVAVTAVGDQFGHHGVVIGRDRCAFDDAGVDATATEGDRVTIATVQRKRWA
jgi:hypothetical protein